MSNANAAIGTDNRLRRCAVCKIDLKGRFVYIDEEIENLLGFTKEELFGKSISEFLVEESQLLIENVLIHRNHYESFYDATEISVVDRNKNAILTSAIISLNFIAGNPVNYQLIINREVGLGADRTDSSALNRLEHFLSSVMALKNMQDMNEIIDHLRRLISADALFVYLVSEKELEPRACSCPNEFSDFSFESIPPPNDLHRAVAASGETYDGSDGTSIRKAVETFGEAPSGIICRREFGPGLAYLFCAQFDPESDRTAAAGAAQQLDLGLNLIEKLIISDGASGIDDQNVDVKFTVGFLDSLGIGAALIGSDGQIAGYNPSYMSLMDVDSLSGDFTLMLEQLSADNPDELIKQLHGYIAGDLDPQSAADLEMEVICPNGNRARLTVVRFSLDASDKSACVTLVSQTIQESGPQPAKINDDLIAKIISSLGEPLDDLYQVSQRLAHENYSDFNDSGKGKLRRLIAQSSRVKLLLLDILNSEKLSGPEHKDQTVDLGLTLDRQIATARQKHPTVDFQCEFGDLPCLQSDPEMVGRILEVLFEQAIKLSGKNSLKVDIVVELIESNCVLSMGHSIASLNAVLKSPQKSGRKAISSLVAENEIEALSSLLAIRYLIERAGGSLNVRSQSKNSFFIDVTLPMA